MAKKEDQTNLRLEEPQSIEDLDFSEKVPGLFAGVIGDSEEDEASEPEEQETSEGEVPEEGEESESQGEEQESDETGNETEESDELKGIPKEQEEPREQEESKDEAQDEDQDKPLAVLKRYGKEYPIHDYNKLVQLAQMGLDYTFKTQRLSGWQKVIQTLQSNPDIMEVIEKRMRGEGGTIPQSEQVSKAKVDQQAEELEIPPQGEDESFEEYVARVANAVAEKKTQAAMQQLTRQQQNQRVIENVRRDPLFEPTTAVISQWLAGGEVPRAVAEKADTDPEAFIWLYQRARSTAEQMLAAQQAQEQPVKPSEKPRKAIQQKPPVVESSRNKRATNSKSQKSPWQDESVIRDLSDEDLEKLVDDVKSGRI